jgi:hypothetical protein
MPPHTYEKSLIKHLQEPRWRAHVPNPLFLYAGTCGLPMEPRLQLHNGAPRHRSCETSVQKKELAGRPTCPNDSRNRQTKGKNFVSRLQWHRHPSMHFWIPCNSSPFPTTRSYVTAWPGQTLSANQSMFVHSLDHQLAMAYHDDDYLWTPYKAARTSMFILYSVRPNTHLLSEARCASGAFQASDTYLCNCYACLVPNAAALVSLVMILSIISTACSQCIAMFLLRTVCTCPRDASHLSCVFF